ncbi:uncharacterized protein B0H18DRAFT_329334 [Fomitopsis serialis]|uniref:uncharacterized protein n=1 Tax=Fomitopsis serialis TaxID=139415 RepID=UPI002007D868|nr:uncharacterized protein B0H18DRAFT_329334 [Neoantrodia serialis]KAH9936681.1 hypothetical protein B0H18DRAFT_329334 [Neoantrodia serialis]
MDVNISESNRDARPDSSSQTRQSIYDGIAYHDRCISDLRARLNTLVPISRLPVEVLSEIFLHTAAVRLYVPGRDHDLHPYHWLQVTRMCRHWRAVALSCTALWSRLTITDQSEGLPVRCFWNGPGRHRS